MPNFFRVRWMLCCLAFCTLASQSATAASFDPQLKWDRLRTAHFTIIYPQSVAPLAQKTAQFAEEAYGILSPKFKWKPLGRTSIVLTDNVDQANGLAAVVPYNILFLRASAPDPHGALASYDEWMRMLVMHELTHIMHMDQARGIMRVPRAVLGKVASPNGVMPGWMREGLAVHEESVNTSAGRNKGMYSDMILRTAADQHTWPRISEGDGLGWKWPGGLTQYLYGGKFIEWLADRYGHEKVVEFQTRSARNPLFFMHNHIAKRVWKKSFYQLWREWRDETSAKHQQQAAAIRAAEETPTEPLPQITGDGGMISALSLSGDGQKMVFASASPYRATELWWKSLTNPDEKVRIQRKSNATSTAIDGAWSKIAYSAMGTRKQHRYTASSDIYLYDIATKKTSALTFNRRASDPSFSPDNKELLYVLEANGSQSIVRHDLATHREQIVPIAAPDGVRFARPQWAPDGKTFAVSSHQNGMHDLFLYQLDGTLVTRVTRDTAVDSSPSWDAAGRVYFASDRSGVSNIYRFDRKTQKIEQLTNVVTGVFEPQPTADGKTLYVQYYTGKGFDVRRVDLAGARRPLWVGGLPVQRLPGDAPVQRLAQSLELPGKKYSPFGPQLLLPRFVYPTIIASGDGLFVTAVTGGHDPLAWHNWLAGVSYRTDAKYLGYAGSYTYNRYQPIVSLGALNYAADSGVRYADGTHIYEKRLRGYAGVALPFGSPARGQSVGMTYFLENRELIPDLSAADRAAFFDLGRFAGVSVSYAIGLLEQYAASISAERKYRITANLTVLGKMFGSHAGREQQIFTGEWRQFFPLGKRQVIAARVKGGIAFGDTIKQGTFSFGGSLGEGAFGGGGSAYYFPFRGMPLATYSSTRAALASVEYRFPIVSPQRGLGTTPFYVQNIHGALFADYGNAWSDTSNNGSWPLDRFMLSVGGEVRGDFIVGHGLPLVGRLGYGIVVHNRDRVPAASVDALTSQPARNGVAVLEIGTSF